MELIRRRTDRIVGTAGDPRRGRMESSVTLNRPPMARTGSSPVPVKAADQMHSSGIWPLVVDARTGWPALVKPGVAPSLERQALKV